MTRKDKDNNTFMKKNLNFIPISRTGASFYVCQAFRDRPKTRQKMSSFQRQTKN